MHCGAVVSMEDLLLRLLLLLLLLARHVVSSFPFNSCLAEIALKKAPEQHFRLDCHSDPSSTE